SLHRGAHPYGRTVGPKIFCRPSTGYRRIDAVNRTRAAGGQTSTGRAWYPRCWVAFTAAPRTSPGVTRARRERREGTFVQRGGLVQVPQGRTSSDPQELAARRRRRPAPIGAPGPLPTE